MVATDTHAETSPGQRLEAWGRAYALISRLLIGPVTADVWSRASAVPVLSDARGDLSIDELGAAHYQLFGLEVFPYGSVFLEVDALASGARANTASELFMSWGYRAATDAAADHLGVQLGFLSHLTRVELSAAMRNDAAQQAVVATCAAEFLDNHVLAYVVPLLAATHAAAVPVFTELVELAVHLVADHRSALAAPVVVSGLPTWKSPVADDKAGLRDIAEFLLAPARSGVWISRGDVTQLGRDHDVPRGFGGRVQTLTNLLRNAGEYDQAGGVLQRLDDLLGARADAYASIGLGLGVSLATEPWLQHIGATRASLREMVRALAERPDKSDT